MADKCAPLHLPIQIETSCAPIPAHHGCIANAIANANANNCQDSCSINTPYTIQSTYQGQCTSTVQQLPSLSIAYLSNMRTQYDSDVSIILNPVCLNWCDFLVLFYRANGVFSVNPSNGTACAINFNAQTYENTTSKCIKFNLAQQVRQAWANKCETSVDNINPKTNLLLNKDTFAIQSLISSSSAVSLTLDQAIETLLNNGEIAPSDSTSLATVRFIIQYKYTFKQLNTTVLINFVYITKIPCYKNLNFCENWCPVYSSDTDCRSCLATTNETTDIEKFLHEVSNSKNFDHIGFDTGSLNGDNDSVSIDNSITPSQGKTMKIDEATHVSVDSSKW